MGVRKASKRQGPPKEAVKLTVPGALEDAVVSRCGVPFRAKLKDLAEGAVHCGFRIDPEVFVGKLSWKRTGAKVVQVRVECSSINPQNGELEGRLDNITELEA